MSTYYNLGFNLYSLHLVLTMKQIYNAFGLKNFDFAASFGTVTVVQTSPEHGRWKSEKLEGHCEEKTR